MAEARRFRIGNQTAFSAVPLTAPFDYAVAHGFDAFEWFPDRKESGAGWAEENIPEEIRRLVRETAVSHDIRLTVHAPLNVDLLCRGSCERLAKTIDFARDIGAGLINVHLNAAEGIGAFVRAIIPLLNRLSGEGIRLSIENTVETGPELFNELFRKIGKKVVPPGNMAGMCLDIGHANLCAATRNDYLKFLDLLEPEVPIIHIHVHENYGDSDSHLTFFTGPSRENTSGIEGLVTRLKKRGFSGSIIMEQWPDPPALLDAARRKLTAIIGNPDAPVDVSHELTGGGILPSLSPRQAASAPPEKKGEDELLQTDFVAEIVRADRKFRSWRKKLDWVNSLFADEECEFTDEKLAYIAVYLRFIGTGQVASEEDGGHYRPSHHAQISRRIYYGMSRLATEDNALILRKIYPYLPSFDTAFMRAEPLTLIRDIAHRNDIPRELKEEIKHTLQNKLHRCAGPEDLATSKALLERITANGAPYPSSFVEEFRKFHDELKEFFNARSLVEQMESISGNWKAEERELAKRFLQAKEAEGNHTDVLETLDLLTKLRRLLIERMNTAAGADEQRLRIADITLEDYSFVVMSRLVNDLSGTSDEEAWPRLLRALFLSIENLEISGLHSEECRAIENELKAWSEIFDLRDRDILLLLRSTLDRSSRLADDYCRTILALFPEKAERLGRALGVAKHSIRFFSEADIRSHPVFQMAKLVSLATRRVKKAAALPPWDVIVPGNATGTVLSVKALGGLKYSSVRELIVLTERVEGDEEIPSGVAAIVVSRETPLLSHLAVRARQDKVPFAVCGDENDLRALRELEGRRIELEVSTDKVHFDIASSLHARGTVERHVPSELPAVTIHPKRLITYDEVVSSNSGGKAFVSGRLAELSLREGADFSVPRGCVIPFGVMEKSLSEKPSLEKEYHALMAGLNSVGGEGVRPLLKKARDIISLIEVPTEILSAIREIFTAETRLMVRSSSNCEDLKEIAGAGLYESVANVPMDSLADAVRKVWSSLWTERAVMARIKSGIRHEKARMAVLLQEVVLSDYSFIMHTVNPANNRSDEIYVELVRGHGETLASGKTPGIPYRMVIHKASRDMRMEAYGSFSVALWPGSNGGLVSGTVDYSLVGLSRDKTLRERCGRRLGIIGELVENFFDGPQDVEGAIYGDTIYLVQSRPQQGVS